ncbi:MAG: succinate dehydrogenase, cytochrome b556 subunit [Caldimonas sp.]
MVTSLKEQPLKRPPVYRNIHISQLISYRMPAAAWASILHRISGAAMFVLLPLVIWMFDASLTSEITYDQFRDVFVNGAGFLPGWLLRIVSFGLIWAYLFHFCAGLRHLWMDATHDLSLRFGRISALAAMVVSTLVAFALGAKLFIF